jgi:HK97 family phage major capsid protein
MSGNVPEEVKEIVSDLKAAVEAKGEKAQKALTELEGYTQKLGNSLKEAEQANSEQKQAFQDHVVKHQKLEDEHRELSQKLMELTNGGGQPAQSKTAGQLAAESDYIKSFNGEHHGTRYIVEKSAGLSMASHQKAVSTAADSAGPLTTPDRRGYIQDPVQPLTVRDLLRTVPTQSGVIDYFKKKSFTNNASTVEEFGLKPTSDIDFEEASAKVQTLAHLMKVSNQALADARQLRGIIDVEMATGLKIYEELQLMFGDGTGSNLNGLAPQATAYAAASVGGADTDSTIDQIRRAMLQASKSFYATDSIVMSMLDWVNITLTKTDDNAYLFTNPVTNNGNVLWGRRVVDSPIMPDGDFLVGSFAMAATIYDREQITIAVSDSHNGAFAENAQWLRFEERLALTVERPDALVAGTFNA